MISHPRLTEKCPIELLPHQVEHVDKIWNLFTKDCAFSIINSSNVGSGKTHCSLSIAWHLQKLYGTQIMIIAPNEISLGSDDGWKFHAEEFGIEIMATATYPSLRGGQGKVSHPWLIPDRNYKKKWKASKEFEKKCQQGLFLIFDEFHNAKNASITHYACCALIKAAKKYRNVCRVALLSYTPGDKPEHIPNILRMAGIITDTKLFRHIPFTTQYEWEQYGLGELAKVCCKLAQNETEKQLIHNKMVHLSAKRVNGICKELYEQYIRPRITFAMPIPENKFKTTLLNAFLENDEKSLRIINDGIDLLSGAVGWDPVTQQVAAHGQWQLGQISTGLKLIERGKLASIVSYIREESKLSPNKKFVICCGARDIKHHEMIASILFKEYTPDQYMTIIQELKEKNENWAKLPKDMIKYISKFLNYKVKVDMINGTVDKKDRTEIIRKFQENTNNSWCLLISPNCGSESISLHDRYGGHPREMLIISDFYFSRCIQACGRVNRVGVQSDSKAMIIYSKNAALETRILTSMIEKSQTARGILAENQQVTFPSDFPYFISGKVDTNLEQQLNDFGMKKYVE